MVIDIVSLFPQIALAPLSDSIIKRAQDKGLVEIRAHQLRDWATGKHKKTDDYLCGGGQGMLLKPEPIFAAVDTLKGVAEKEGRHEPKVILMTPQGKPLKQAMAQSMTTHESLIILCGHYEGVDHRVIEHLVDFEISLGDFILTNGAIAAAVLTDAIVRLLPDALGDSRSSEEESFSTPSLLEAPAYTKPIDFNGLKVPEVLSSGHHGKITEWKKQAALERTRANRPDLLQSEG